MVRKKFVSPESIITKPEKLVNLRLKKILQIQTDASSPALFSCPQSSYPARGRKRASILLNRKTGTFVTCFFYNLQFFHVFCRAGPSPSKKERVSDSPTFRGTVSTSTRSCPRAKLCCMGLTDSFFSRVRARMRKEAAVQAADRLTMNTVKIFRVFFRSTYVRISSRYPSISGGGLRTPRG